jgi:hypothetical protein
MKIKPYGLVARIKRGSGILNRTTLVQVTPLVEQARNNFEKEAVAAMLRDLGADQRAVVRPYLWAHNIAMGMDMPDAKSREVKCYIHAGGYGLLRELDAQNVFFVQRDLFDVDFHTCEGSARAVYEFLEDWMQEKAKELGVAPFVTDYPPEWDGEFLNPEQ